ncbi:MAG: LPS-assembly protein LptD [Sphingomonas sp.]
MAQDLRNRSAQPAPPESPQSPDAPQADAIADGAKDDVRFSADTISYDTANDIVTASGDVRMYREGDRLRADKVVWNRKSGEVVATGNIAISNPGGDAAYGDSVTLTDSLKDGMVENLLVVLDQGGRLAAQSGTRNGDVVTLDNAAYSPCAVTDLDNCPQEPSWKITAVRIVYDAAKQRIHYRGARLSLLGLPSIPLPVFSSPAGDGAQTGFLAPDLKYSRVNGAELSLPYYFKIAPNRGIAITPRIYSGVLPLLGVEYKALTSTGAYRIAAYGTASARTDTLTAPTATNLQNAFRGYLDVSGRFQLSPNWSVSGSLRVTTDRTFLRRYDISTEDVLRSTVKVERIDANSYLSIAGWGVQTLRVGDVQGLQPIALPEIDYRKRLATPVFGGKIELQVNSLAIGRTAGQDTQRAFASARWDLRRITPFGQLFTLTAYGRGDIYNADQTAATSIISYRGTDGFRARAIGAVAADVQWPFVGNFLGGTQRFTPRVQVVAAPQTANLAVPNEDARAVDLEDSNLFALNRFPGYDRFEDSARFTYGLQWSASLPNIALDATIGQSYRLSSRPTIFPDGTGLTDRVSDIVGRTELRYKEFLTFVHRYRLDKDGLAIRRNEIDTTIGSRATYVLFGYLRLNRNIVPTLEDLRDREELRAGGRVQISRFWSAFGSAVIDLTDRREDPLSLSDGFTPIRHRIGVAYETNCLKLGLTWKRDYQDTGDARRGDSFLLTVAFRNLGR